MRERWKKKMNVERGNKKGMKRKEEEERDRKVEYEKRMNKK